MAKLGDVGELFFSEQFLEPRPLLRALRQPGGAVLLIDEIDKADEAFEAFLLEILSDYQVTIPEIGMHHAAVPADRVADVQQHPRPRRRDEAPLPPSAHRLAGTAAGGADHREPRARPSSASLRKQLVHFVQQLRALDLRKLPSISETIDWARALVLLHATELDPQLVRDTLNVLLKFEGDMASVGPKVGELAHKARDA